ncbi:MAG: amidohydrolase family protein [Cloacibacillus sp.]
MNLKIKCGAVADLVSGKDEKNVDIYIQDGKIEKISKNTSEKAENEIDLSEYYIIPGFVDAHNHLCFDVGDEVKQIGEALGYQALIAAKNARIAISSGVTTLRDAGERGYVDFCVKRGVDEGLIPGPRLLAAGPGLMRTGGHMWFMGEEADGESEVRKAVRGQLKAGADFIKIFVSGGATSQRTGSVTPEMTREEIETAIYEAHAAGKKAGAHTHGGIAATWAIKAGVDAIEHGCFLTEEQMLLMKDNGTFLVVTSGIQRAIAECPENSPFMREKAAAAYANYLTVIKRAVQLGLRMALGNDTNHGCIAEEIAFVERAGMSRREALLAATRYGADLCGLESLTGTIEPGKEADLIAFASNPLTADIRELTPQWVIRSGKTLKTPHGIHC